MPNTSHASCHTYGHAWFEVPAEEPAPWGEPLWLRCERCSTVRKDYVDPRDGQVLGRRYAYAKDYLQQLAEGEAAMTRTDFRLLLIRERIDAARAARARHPRLKSVS